MEREPWWNDWRAGWPWVTGDYRRVLEINHSMLGIAPTIENSPELVNVELPKLISEHDTKSHNFEFQGCFSESTGFPVETVGSLVKFLIEEHAKGRVLAPFTKDNLLFRNYNFTIDCVSKLGGCDSLYLGDFKQLWQILSEERAKFVVKTEHQRLELGQFLGEMKRRDLSYDRLKDKLLYHPIVLNLSETQNIIARIVDIFDKPVKGVTSKVERANISYIKDEFIFSMELLRHWRKEILPEYENILDLASFQNESESIILMLRSVRNIESLQLLCELFPNFLLFIYDFELYLDDGKSIRLWNYNQDVNELSKRSIAP